MTYDIYLYLTYLTNINIKYLNLNLIFQKDIFKFILTNLKLIKWMYVFFYASEKTFEHIRYQIESNLII